MSSSLPMIPEILRIICEHMASHKPSLASFARTCTRIEEPALDVLWFNIEGLYPLVKCLPSNLWSEQGHEDKLSLMLQLPITLSDCSRLARYARRIRRFSSEPPEGVNKYADASIYNGLQVALQGEKLLPNVRRLKWTCSNDTVPCLQMFLGPHLVNIQLKASASSPEQLSLLPVLFHQHPSLESFHFSFHDSDDPPSQTVSAGERWTINLISHSISKLNSLEALTVPSLSYSAIMQLSLLPNLKSLGIKHCNFGSDVKHEDISGRFQALQSLRLDSCASVSDCFAILELMDHSPIVKMHVYMDTTETQSSWEKLFVTINNHCQHHTLKDIHCHDGCNEETLPGLITRSRAEMVDVKVLKPLLQFTNLEKIDIEIVRELAFGDTSVIPETMASSWKKLETLRMENAFYNRCEEPSTITLLDLIYFAEHCPNLEILGLRIDARSTPEIDEHDIPWCRAQGSKVTELYVGDSPIGDPGLVSAALSGIFPKLEFIKTTEEGEEMDSDNHKAWKAAQNLLKVFASVRKQERSFAKLTTSS